MVNMQIHGIILLNVGSPEVVRVKATLGRLLTALPSEKIYSPLHIHIAPELLIPQDQATHAPCVLRLQSLEILSFTTNLVFTCIQYFFSVISRRIKSYFSVYWFAFVNHIPDGVLNWGVECKSVLPVRVGHPKFFPCKQVLKGGVMAGDLRKVSVTESEVACSCHSFNGPTKLISVHLNVARGEEWHSFSTPVVLLQLLRCCTIEMGLAVWISNVC